MQNPKPDNSIMRAIQKAFRQSGRSINSVAKEANISYSAVHGLLTGSRDASTGVASRIAEALSIEMRPIRKKKAQ